MLIFNRYLDQTFRVGNDIEITIVGIDGGQVRLGIVAPKEISVHREEVYEKIKGQAAASQEPPPVPVTIVKTRRRISNGA